MRIKLLTWYRLGLINVSTVMIYRILKRLGYYNLILPITSFPKGNIFSKTTNKEIEKYTVSYFSHHSIKVSSPPDWFLNPWNKARANKTKFAKRLKGVSEDDELWDHWSKLPDFTDELGDIKLIWELSRFDWLPKMAWQYKNGDLKKLPLLETWSRDWLAKNPVNSGVNWKCGQEASFRCLNLILSSLLINNSFNKPSETFLYVLEAHLTRIAPTLRYAMAQDNNHGSSEAATLFVVGEYLHFYGSTDQKNKGMKWAKKGRFWLENRVQRLIMNDGSFSQYSVTYHRLFLDSLSFVELIRIKLGIANFSSKFYEKMESAVQWLYHMTDTLSGDAPNLGANDGAYLFNINGAEYRDFRPCIQLGAAVFLKKSTAFNIQESHPLLSIFEIPLDKLPTLESKPEITSMLSGGYILLNKSQIFIMMRLPIYRFRPSHADALHLDVWANGENLLTDDGSYSYNTDSITADNFAGTKSHNTIQFDDRDQMPRLSRFLYGKWLKATELDSDHYADDALTSTASYTDYLGASHRRAVTLSSTMLQVKDTVSGFQHKAVLRWRLQPGNWVLSDTGVSNGDHRINITSSSPITRMEITQSWNSLYYLQKKPLPVLEVEINQPGKLTTEYHFHI